MNDTIDNLKKLPPDIVEIAKKKRHLFLLEKLRSGRQLNAAEIRDIEKMETKNIEHRTSNDERAAATVDGTRICKTQSEAAKYAGVSTRTIQRWLEDGMLAAQMGGKAVYIKDELDRFKLNKGKKATDARVRRDEADADYREKRVKLLDRQMADIEKEIDERVKEEILKRTIKLKRLLKNIGRNIAAEVILMTPKDAQKRIEYEIEHALKVYTGVNDNDNQTSATA